ncbi:hypothetical protein [Sutcliffiella horikoshii]|uniref:hypothetical protein n=1 Tax=Sutcliffiella horikoshii TaxID=79883 RepID=UPI003CF4A23D
MLDIFDGNSKVYKEVLHEALSVVVEDFMEIGGNLEYDDIYGTVFPPHKQEEEDREKQGLAFLKRLQREIMDNFPHVCSPLKEYVLFHILWYVHDGTEGTFLLTDTIQKSLKENNIDNLYVDELKVLNSIKTPRDLIGVCFEDLDFLDVGDLFDTYKKYPQYVTDFLHVDLDYYQELMPDDILSEFKEIQEYLHSKDRQANQDTENQEMTDTINSNEDFYKVVDSLIADFKHFIEHKKGHILINDKRGLATEKQVQVKFDMLANATLPRKGIVVSKEVDTGRGIVDFQLSKGADFQALIELKLGNHQRYKDGLHFQLPTYLLTEQVDFGYFVLVCYTKDIYEASKALYDKAIELSQKYNKTIRFERVDASGTLESASKIRKEEGMGFN